MWRFLLTFIGCTVVTATGVGQSLAELDTAAGISNTLSSAPTGPPPGLPPIAPGTVPGPPNLAGGLVPAPATALPGPAAQPALNAFDVDANAPDGGAPAIGQPAAQPGIGGAAVTPTPQPTLTVLKGNRVYDAVTNALLEDAYQVAVPLTEKDRYADDGIHDNGIAGDGIRGQVSVVKGQFIGAETNVIKNQLIRLVRNAEEMPVPTFYGYHIMSVNPTEEGPVGKAPNVLEKEAQRDQVLRDWNAKFLADYRVRKDDPRSEYYQLYVPDPPQLPTYPVPPGYVAPQKQLLGQPGVPGGQPTPNIFNGDPVIDVPM